MDLGPLQSATKQTTPPRDASTVLLLREENQGFSVFMIKRHHLSDVLGSAYVFPGGKVDATDRDERWAQHAILDTSPSSRLPLGDTEPAIRWRSLQIAAIRETFEESAILLTKQNKPSPSTGILKATDHSPTSVSDADSTRKTMSEGFGFLDAIIKQGLCLDGMGLIPWIRWVTPATLAKRFDTWFFLAIVPTEQTALHDNHEAVDSRWITPAHALKEWENHDIQLAPATYMSLRHLALHHSLDSVLEEARGFKQIATVQPQPYEVAEKRYLALPGDPHHPLSETALPGPTCLCWEDGRFVPV